MEDTAGFVPLFHRLAEEKHAKTMSKTQVHSIQEQVYATIGRTAQLVRYIEEHFGNESVISAQARIALQSLVDLHSKLSDGAAT